MKMTKETMPETIYRASRCCRILGNPAAYLVMRHLGCGRKTPSQLAAELNFTVCAISVTLRHLRNVDLVRYQTVGKGREYWVKDPKALQFMRVLEKWVMTMRSKQL